MARDTQKQKGSNKHAANSHRHDRKAASHRASLRRRNDEKAKNLLDGLTLGKRHNRVVNNPDTIQCWVCGIRFFRSESGKAKRADHWIEMHPRHPGKHRNTELNTMQDALLLAAAKNNYNSPLATVIIDTLKKYKRA